MELRENSRVESVKQKRETKDLSLTKTQTERDWQLMLKREMDLIKREDKLENVGRIGKAQEYKKLKVLEKIEFGNMKGEQIKKEKEKLLETRFHVRREADKQKQTVLEAFENMKKKGKIDNTQLNKLGIDLTIKEDPIRETQVNNQDVEEVKERQNKELKQLLEQEKKAETDRQAKINSAADEEQKAKFTLENEQAKAISSDRIVKLQNKHQQELRALGVAV